MKFSHLLSKFISVDENKNDGAHPNFVSYKALKKCLRAAAQKHEAFNADHGAKGEPLGALPLTEDEKEFAAILKSDIETINKYFMEKEEEAVIRLQALNERRASGADAAQMMQEFADFHGEMVLLLHWSLINYGKQRRMAWFLNCCNLSCCSCMCTLCDLLLLLVLFPLQLAWPKS